MDTKTRTSLRVLVFLEFVKKIIIFEGMKNLYIISGCNGDGI